MTLRPTDMLMIQTAIDEYERKFPRRPAPSAEVALSWRLGKREAKRILAQELPTPTAGRAAKGDDSLLADQECNRFVWAWQQFWLYVNTWDPTEVSSMGGPVLWVRRAIVVGWWGVVAVAVVSVFFFGALVGGFK